MRNNAADINVSLLWMEDVGTYRENHKEINMKTNMNWIHT